MIEEWKPLPNYDGYYDISNHGRVRRTSTGRVLKLKKNVDGYNVVCLSVNNIKKEVRVGRKVAEAFIRKPENDEVVNHIDCDKTNDFVDNLEWTDVSGNTQHAYNNGLITNWLKGVVGEQHPFSKKYIITTPDNIEVEIKGLSQYCRDNKLCLRSMYKVLSGNIKQYKGYTLRRVDESRTD